jgi:glycosyltransferase involved in cell wall biosynthesis
METKPLCPTCGAALVDLRTQDAPAAGWRCGGSTPHWFNTLPQEPAEESCPLVSVITPTRHRRQFIPQLLAGFRAQDWPNKELVIVADGEDIEDLLDGTNPPWMAEDPNCECSVLHIRHESALPNAAARIAEALNVGIRAARGTYCVRFDDDDWQAPGRIMQQVALLSMTGKAVVAASSGLFLTESGEAFEYTGLPWDCPGMSHAFVRDYALAHLYDETGHAAEDGVFMKSAYELGELCAVSGVQWLVASDHGNNSQGGGRFSGPGQGENDPPFQMIDGEFVINLRKSDNWRRVSLERIAAIVPALT